MTNTDRIEIVEKIHEQFRLAGFEPPKWKTNGFNSWRKTVPLEGGFKLTVYASVTGEFDGMSWIGFGIHLVIYFERDTASNMLIASGDEPVAPEEAGRPGPFRKLLGEVLEKAARIFGRAAATAGTAAMLGDI